MNSAIHFTISVDEIKVKVSSQSEEIISFLKSFFGQAFDVVETQDADLFFFIEKGEEYNEVTLEHQVKGRRLNVDGRIIVSGQIGETLNDLVMVTPPNQVYIFGSNMNNVMKMSKNTIRLCITLLLRKKGWALIHASGVVKNEKGIIFVGNKGAGKTTSMLQALMDNDTSFLGNDRLMIHPKRNLVLGWPTTALIGRGSISALPNLSHLIKEDDDYNDTDKKVPIFLEELQKKLGVSHGKLSRLKAIVFPRINTQTVTNLKENSISMEIAHEILTDNILSPDEVHPNWLGEDFLEEVLIPSSDCAEQLLNQKVELVELEVGLPNKEVFNEIWKNVK